MSNIKHANEPWHWAPDTRLIWVDTNKIEGYKGNGAVICEIADLHFPHLEVAANGARIVACVNAMAGIEEPQAFRDSLEKLVSYANKASEMFAEKDAKIKQLYTAAENLWQTLNALQMVVGVHLDQDTRKQIKEALANNNPSNYSA